MVKWFILGCVSALILLPFIINGIDKTNGLLGAITIMMMYKIFIEDEEKGGNND